MKCLWMNTVWGNTPQVILHPRVCLESVCVIGVRVRMVTYSQCKLVDVTAGTKKG